MGASGIVGSLSTIALALILSVFIVHGVPLRHTTPIFQNAKYNEADMKVDGSQRVPPAQALDELQPEAFVAYKQQSEQTQAYVSQHHDQHIPTESDPTWKLIWEDDFTGSAINTTNWNVAQNYTHGDQELQLYLSDEVSVSGGNLVLRTQKRDAVYKSGKLYHYTSGWVDTKNKYFHKFGRFEIRAKLPNSRSTGIWPAHWLMPQPTTSTPPKVCWPVGGEIDIMEQTANIFLDQIFGSYRRAKNSSCCCGDNVQVLPGAPYPPFGAKPINYTADYHVFGVEWNTTTLAFSVDGNVFHVKTSDEVYIPQDPFYVILNTAIAWYWKPGPDALYPVYHIIDWVRVYDKVGSGEHQALAERRRESLGMR